MYFFLTCTPSFSTKTTSFARYENQPGRNPSAERERDGVPCDRYTDWLQAPPLSSSPSVRCRGAVSPSPFQFRLTTADEAEVRARVMPLVRKPRQLGDVTVTTQSLPKKTKHQGETFKDRSFAYCFVKCK